MYSGRDLIGVQNLIKKHQAVLAEINNHENRIAAVCQSGQQMLDDGHFAGEEIKQRIGILNDHWTQLKEKALQVSSAIICYILSYKFHIYLSERLLRI
jgi:spectrin alpha